MKTYLLFSGQTHYPDGGIKDYKGDFDDVSDALHVAREAFYYDWDDFKENPYHNDWYQIVLSSDMSIVREGKL